MFAEGFVERGHGSGPWVRGGGDDDRVRGTAGSGDTYRIERIYLDREQAYGFAQDRCPAGPPTTAPTGGRCERFDDFAIRQEWWTGDALPDAKVVRRELAGVPRVEVVGRSKEKVEETFWDTITQVRADLAGIQKK